MAEPSAGPSCEGGASSSAPSASASADRPKRGILKSSTSFDTHERKSSLKETKWDEMNIIATLHPADKDYGHIKIDEPKTPFNYVVPNEHDEEILDETAIANMIRVSGEHSRRRSHSETVVEEDNEDLTEEERAHKSEFRERRRSHYNEFHAVKLARQLMASDEEQQAEDEGQEAEEGASSSSAAAGVSENSAD